MSKCQTEGACCLADGGASMGGQGAAAACNTQLDREPLTKSVRAMLIMRSQLQPVIMATAAGGKMMAMSAMRMSEPRTIVM